MRIQILDLLRYGHFTDMSLQFQSAGPDFHVVFGENEAGKSTTMSAIEDLLFGIPEKTTRNFMHDNAALRIGATLDHNGSALPIRRRRGRKDTLLGPDDVPVAAGDGLLGPLTGGIDRAFYCRMFCLDHERLRDGGREIIQAKDEIGATLFAAGAGISGLSERLAAMQEEAEGYWDSRKAGHRKYYQAEQRFKDAEKVLREQITATKWNALKSTFHEERDTCGLIEKDIESQSVELTKISRVRRVFRNVRRLAEVESEIASLVPVVDMSADAASALAAATAEDNTAQTRINTIQEQIAAAKMARDAIAVDENVLLHEDDIARLSKRNIQLISERESLPKRRAELAAAEETFKLLAAELGWSGNLAELIGKIPQRGKVSVVQGLLTARGVRAAAVTNARSALAEAEENAADLQARMETAGEPKDVSALTGIVKSIRALGDLDARLLAALREFDYAEGHCRVQLATLNPAATDEALLRFMKVPAVATVQAQRDSRRDVEKGIKAQEAAIRETTSTIASCQKSYERLVADEDIVSAEELAALRQNRDAGWSIIRRRHIDGVSVPDVEEQDFTSGGPLLEVYEDAIGQADGAADKRFQNASLTAESMVLARQLAEKKDTLGAQQDELSALSAQQETQAAAWVSLWKDCTDHPLGPEEMLVWLKARADLLVDIEERDAASRSIEALRNQIGGAKKQVADLLADSAVSASIDALSLGAILGAAETHIREEEAVSKKHNELTLDQRKAKTEVERKRSALGDAEKEQESWEAEWKAGLAGLNLSADVPADGVQKQIEAIDQMRLVAMKITDLQHERIGKIERDMEGFAVDMARLVASVAPGLPGEDPQESILRIKAQFDAAQRAREALADKNGTIEEREEKLEEIESSRKDAQLVIGGLQKTAKVEDVDALRQVIEVSDRRRTLFGDRDSLHNALDKDGDGLSIDTLIEECRSHDLDQAAAREDYLKQSVDALRERHLEAVQRRNEAERAFLAIGGDEAAAIAASDRQVAVAEMKDAAAQYARLHAASLILRWAIERFRREKQAPLVKRAGELFAIQTGGLYERLTVGLDEKDQPYLAGVQSDGSVVPVGSLSDGAADQLFLALRVAAVEEYLEHASPVPFVADDLFINYDDRRALAGFQVLRELAKKTQVLFFTHHQHLVELARNVFGGQVSTTLIERQATPMKNVA